MFGFRLRRVRVHGKVFRVRVWVEGSASRPKPSVEGICCRGERCERGCGSMFRGHLDVMAFFVEQNP